MPELDGLVVAVTGTARGMVRANTQGFLAHGARVVAMDRSWEPTGFSGDTHDAFRRELEARPADVLLALFLARQNAGAGPTGRCFDTVTWNIEHGLGGPDAWADADADSGAQQAAAKWHPAAS